jgi:hypothetical protein
MAQYLLSTYGVAGEPEASPPSPEDMQLAMEHINALEAEMKATGTFVFSARLTDPDQANVLTVSDSDVLVTDGPFPEAKEQIAGFYIIDADDHDSAMNWAKKVTECIGRPIEARAILHSASGD